LLSDSHTGPQIGQVVQVTKGRERNQYAVIINILDGRFVLLADGERRKYDCPKKKNVLHIELTPFISNEVRTSLLETNRVSNGKLRFALAKYRSEVVTALEKGDGNDV